MSGRFHAKDGELVVLYECDPSKNTKCRKTNCKERGGPCQRRRARRAPWALCLTGKRVRRRTDFAGDREGVSR